MFEKLKNKRFKILLGVALLSVFSLIYLFSTKKTPPIPISPYPTPPPLTTSFPIPLLITNSYPPSGNFILTMPNTALTFTLTRKAQPTEVRIEIEPKVELKLWFSPDGYYLHATPSKPWQFDRPYQITVIGPQEKILAQNTVVFLDPKKHPPETEFDEIIP